MLEVLDSEQNSHFRDHYIEVPIDLSQVLFIATANDASAIPRPLYDRMEVIDVSSYTENEKYHIATEHLIEKQMKKNGLKEGQLELSDSAVEKLIQINPNANDVLKFTEQIDQNVDDIAELQSDFNGMGAMKRYFHSGSKVFDNTESTIPAGTTIYFRPISADDSRTGLIMYGLYSANESDGLDKLFPQALFGVTGKIVTEREYHHVRVVTYPYGGTEFSFDYLRTNTPGVQPDISV